MDFCRVTEVGDPSKGTPDKSTVIFTTHQKGPDDVAPLQMVSAEQVAYWQQVELEYLRLLESMAEPVVNSTVP